MGYKETERGAGCSVFVGSGILTGKINVREGKPLSVVILMLCEKEIEGKGFLGGTPVGGVQKSLQ
jgi:hypothetical protein